jgi:hypothetical protein
MDNTVNFVYKVPNNFINIVIAYFVAAFTLTCNFFTNGYKAEKAIMEDLILPVITIFRI